MEFIVDFNGIRKKFKGCLREVSKVFQESVEPYSTKIIGCLRDFYEYFNRMSRIFLKNFKACLKGF